jgi:hypothetical protein
MKLKIVGTWRAAVLRPYEDERGRWSSWLLRFGIEGDAHGGDEAVPAGLFFAEAFPARGGEFVILRAAVVVGSAPACFEKALANEAEEGGVEGALFDEESATGNLLDAEEDAVAVERAEGDGFENEQIEGAGKEIGLR